MVNWSRETNKQSSRLPIPSPRVPLPKRWPENLTFDEACEFCGISDVHARQLKLQDLWRQFGVDVTIPGEKYPKWRKSMLLLWLDSLQAAQHEGREYLGEPTHQLEAVGNRW